MMTTITITLETDDAEPIADIISILETTIPYIANNVTITSETNS